MFTPSTSQWPSADIAPRANGLQVFRGEVYVANSSSAEILAYRIRANGTAGPGRVHAGGVGGDDFAFDVAGNLFITTDPFNTLIRVAPDGSHEVLLSADDGLDGPTACAFGRSFGGGRTLDITNAAFPFFSTTFRPSVMSVPMPLPGAGERERQVAQLASRGLSALNIAARLEIKESTVAVHLRRIHRKLEVHTRVELTRVMLRWD